MSDQQYLKNLENGLVFAREEVNMLNSSAVRLRATIYDLQTDLHWEQQWAKKALVKFNNLKKSFIAEIPSLRNQISLVCQEMGSVSEESFKARIDKTLQIPFNNDPLTRLSDSHICNPVLEADKVQ